jgi:hypothetical protein
VTTAVERATSVRTLIAGSWVGVTIGAGIAAVTVHTPVLRLGYAGLTAWAVWEVAWWLFLARD